MDLCWKVFYNQNVTISYFRDLNLWITIRNSIPYKFQCILLYTDYFRNDYIWQIINNSWSIHARDDDSWSCVRLMRRLIDTTCLHTVDLYLSRAKNLGRHQIRVKETPEIYSLHCLGSYSLQQFNQEQNRCPWLQCRSNTLLFEHIFISIG